MGIVPQVPAIARVDLSAFPRAGVEAGAEGGAGREGREGGGAGDADTLRHVKTNVIAGCCLALGLRYAG